MCLRAGSVCAAQPAPILGRDPEPTSLGSGWAEVLGVEMGLQLSLKGQHSRGRWGAVYSWGPCEEGGERAPFSDGGRDSGHKPCLSTRLLCLVLGSVLPVCLPA